MNKETKQINEANFIRRRIEQLSLLEGVLGQAENNSVLSGNADYLTPEVTENQGGLADENLGSLADRTNMNLVILHILMLMSRLQSSTATNNVDITASNTKILFSKIGRLIPEILFATITVKLDLPAVINESNDICDTARALMELLQG